MAHIWEGVLGIRITFLWRLIGHAHMLGLVCFFTSDYAVSNWAITVNFLFPVGIHASVGIMAPSQIHG